jgi:hypothetical protein
MILNRKLTQQQNKACLLDLQVSRERRTSSFGVRSGWLLQRLRLRLQSGKEVVMIMIVVVVVFSCMRVPVRVGGAISVGVLVRMVVLGAAGFVGE